MNVSREPSTPLSALHALVVESFSADELRRWLRHGPDADIVPDLPGEPTSLSDLVDRALAALERRGRLDAGFFERMSIERPQRWASIRIVAERWAVSLPPLPTKENPDHVANNGSTFEAGRSTAPRVQARPPSRREKARTENAAAAADKSSLPAPKFRIGVIATLAGLLITGLILYQVFGGADRSDSSDGNELDTGSAPSRECKSSDECYVTALLEERGFSDAQGVRRATRLFTLGCASGHPGSCVQLGEMYGSRLPGRDNETALKFFTRACELHYLPGCVARECLTRPVDSECIRLKRLVATSTDMVFPLGTRVRRRRGDSSGDLSSLAGYPVARVGEIWSSVDGPYYRRGFWIGLDLAGDIPAQRPTDAELDAASYAHEAMFVGCSDQYYPYSPAWVVDELRVITNLDRSDHSRARTDL